MSDTPETDACKSATRGESIFDLCERLGRERDEAREAWYQMQSSFERSRDEVERVIRERDEARHKLELCMAANSDVARIAKERDEAREENAKLISIADMARAKLTALRTHQDRSIRELVSKERAVNSLLRQLDKAREDVLQLHDIKRKHEHEELVAAQENDRLKLERDEAREQNAKLRDIAEKAIVPLECDGVPWGAKLRAELDQLKEGAK